MMMSNYTYTISTKQTYIEVLCIVLSLAVALLLPINRMIEVKSFIYPPGLRNPALRGCRISYLLNKQLDVTTDPENPRNTVSLTPYYFQSILKEGKDTNNNKIIAPHHIHINQLYGVIMAWILRGDVLAKSIYNSTRKKIHCL